MKTWDTGVHEHLDIDTYHRQCCPGPSISSSGLRTIIASCPAIYWAHSDLNPDRVPDDTAALSLGRAVHALVLGEPEFNKKFIISPYDDFRTREAKDWRSRQDRQVVKPGDMTIIHAMVDAQRASPQVAHAFIKGKPEMSIIWQDKETEVWLKARPDWLADDITQEFCVEYKTATSIAPRALSYDAFRYGYHLQAALQIDGLQQVYDRKPLGVAHVVQMKVPPYLAELRMFTADQIQFGRMQYRHALHIFADCLAKKRWPGYTSEPQFFQTPFQVQRFMENPNEYAIRYGDDAAVSDDFVGTI